MEIPPFFFFSPFLLSQSLYPLFLPPFAMVVFAKQAGPRLGLFSSFCWCPYFSQAMRKKLSMGKFNSPLPFLLLPPPHFFFAPSLRVPRPSSEAFPYQRITTVSPLVLVSTSLSPEEPYFPFSVRDSFTD